MSAIEDAMSQTVIAMWESLLESEIHPTEAKADDASREFALVGCIHISGPDGGVVTLECPEALAREAASTMFQIQLVNVSTEDAQDALGELTNIMGGNFKALLNEGHLLSLPTVVEGRDFRTRFIGTELSVRAAFDCADRHLVASFYRYGARASGNAREHAHGPSNA